jgi:hypothetical protein
MGSRFRSSGIFSSESISGANRLLAGKSQLAVLGKVYYETRTTHLASLNKYWVLQPDRADTPMPGKRTAAGQSPYGTVLATLPATGHLSTVSE